MRTAACTAILAVASTVYAVPLPNGLMGDVQNDCTTSTSAHCIPAKSFLSHLAQSEDKYLHLVHPETGEKLSVYQTRASLPGVHHTSGSSPDEEEEENISGAMSGQPYTHSLHPASYTTYTPNASGSTRSYVDHGAYHPDTVSAGPHSSTVSPHPLPGTPIAKTTTTTTSKGSAAGHLDASSPTLTANETEKSGPPASATAAVGAPSKLANVAAPMNATANQTTSDAPSLDGKTALPAGNKTDTAAPMADATGVANAPGLVGPSAPPQADGALGAHQSIAAPLLAVVFGAIGATFIL